MTTKIKSIIKTTIYLLPLLAFVLLFVLFSNGITSIQASTLQAQRESLETALLRSTAQCYAVEGFYPPNIEYLQYKYGIIYDETLFFVDYQSIGSNIMPDITVILR